MIKTIVATVFFLSLFIVAVAFVVPGFIDWNVHKGEIVRQLSPYFQRKIDIAGKISLKVLPQPEIMLESVTVENVPGAKTGPLASLRQLGGRLNLKSLFEGRLEVESMELVDPVINLEVMEDGKPGWLGVMQEKSADALGSAASAIQLNRVTVANGTLNYTNQATGKKLTVQNLNLSITANTLRGPYKVNGIMKYRDQSVTLEMASEKYDGKSPVPVAMTFIPAANMPEVKMNGVMDLQSGLDLQGEMTIGKGSLASLFGDDALEKIKFMRDDANIQGVMLLKGGQFTLTEMKAKFGEKGSVRGKVSVQTTAAKPAVMLDVTAENLVIAEKGADVYMEPPTTFDAVIRAKGKNIGLGDRAISTIDMHIETAGKDWRVKSAVLDLPGPSQLKVAGTIMPVTDSAVYNIHLTTSSLGKLAASFAPADGTLFKALADTGVIGKMSLNGALSVQPTQLGLTSIDALVEDKMKISGEASFDRGAEKPSFIAKLAFTDWDASAEPFAAFAKQALLMRADIDLTATNFTRNNMHLADMSLKGKLGEQFDLAYAVKADRAESALLPPPFMSWDNIDVSGTATGTLPQYTFNAGGTVNGTEVQMSGEAAEGVYTQGTLAIRDPDAANILSLLDLPASALLEGGVAGEFSGQISGTREEFRVENMALKAGAATLSGRLEKKGEAYLAQLSVPKFDIDKWLGGEWNVKRDVVLKVETPELTWHGQQVTGAEATLEVGASGVKISGLQGSALGGKLSAEDTRTRTDKSWSSAFKGRVEDADLFALATRIGIKGIEPGNGTITFDLTTADGLSAATGSVSVTTDTLKIANFSFDELGNDVDALDAVPKDLPQFVTDSLQKTKSAFSNVTVKGKVEMGTVSFNNLKLASNAGDLKLDGELNVKDGSYKMSGDLRLAKPEGFPALKLKRSSAMENVSVDTAPVEKFIIKNIPPPLEMQPDVAPVADPVKALPPEKKEEDNAVKDILKRLDEEPMPPPATPEPLAPEPSLPPEPLAPEALAPAPLAPEAPVESAPAP